MDATKVKVRELMQSNVARLDVETPVNEAISLLEGDRISGAPVVEAEGRVVGVISLSDIVRAKDAEGSGSEADYYMPYEGIDEEADEYEYKEDYSPATLPSGTVSEWMSENVVSVGPDDSIRTACQRMRDRRIHRVLVLDDAKLVGILSSFDVVRWIAEK